MDFYPVRKVVHRANRKHVGYFPSRKIGRQVAFESLLERNYFFLLEYDPEVENFCEQPLDITFLHNGKKRHYYPDVAVERNGQIHIVEIKPSSKLNDVKLIPKFLSGINYCNAKDYQYRIITEKHMDKQILKNVKMLFGYSGVDVPASIRLRIRTELGVDELSIQELCTLIQDKCGNYTKALIAVYNQLYHRNLECDITHPINLATKVTLRGWRLLQL